METVTALANANLAIILVCTIPVIVIFSIYVILFILEKASVSINTSFAQIIDFLTVWRIKKDVIRLPNDEVDKLSTPKPLPGSKDYTFTARDSF